MNRLSVSLPPPQYRWLTSEAKRLGITIGELIRRILDEKRSAPARGATHDTASH